MRGMEPLLTYCDRSIAVHPPKLLACPSDELDIAHTCNQTCFPFVCLATMSGLTLPVSVEWVRAESPRPSSMIRRRSIRTQLALTASRPFHAAAASARPRASAGLANYSATSRKRPPLLAGGLLSAKLGFGESGWAIAPGVITMSIKCIAIHAWST